MQIQNYNIKCNKYLEYNPRGNENISLRNIFVSKLRAILASYLFESILKILSYKVSKS